MKRHTILNRDLHESLRRTQRIYERKRLKLRRRLAEPNRSQAGHRIGQLSWAVGQAALQHLGYGPIRGLRSILNEGVDNAVEFFRGDWWQRNEDDRYVRAKHDEYPVQGWHWAMLYGVLLCDWADRWQDALPLLDWVDDDVARGICHDDPYLKYHLYLVSSAHHALPHHEQLAESIRTDPDVSACDRRRLDVCDALAENDDGKFADSLAAALDEFLRTEAQDVPNHLYWVSLDASLLWTFARHGNLRLPALTPLQDAAIVRCETVSADLDEQSDASGWKRWAFWK